MSSNCFIFAGLNAGLSSSSFFSWHRICVCHLSDLRLCALSSISLFFTWVLTGGLSLGFECQQASSGLKDSSEYFSRSQQCYSLYRLDSISDFQFCLSFFLLGTVLTAPTTISITDTFIFYSFFLLSGKIQVCVYLFAFIHLLSVVHWDSKSTR